MCVFVLFFCFVAKLKRPLQTKTTKSPMQIHSHQPSTLIAAEIKFDSKPKDDKFSFDWTSYNCIQSLSNGTRSFEYVFDIVITVYNCSRYLSFKYAF